MPPVHKPFGRKATHKDARAGKGQWDSLCPASSELAGVRLELALVPGTKLLIIPRSHFYSRPPFHSELTLAAWCERQL